MSRWPTLLALFATNTFVWLSLSATPSATSPTMLEEELLRSATLVFQRAVDERAAAIPASVLFRAQGIAVFPQSVKDGVGYSGQGVFSARGANPSVWTPPAIVALTGAIPLELESLTVDFILIAQTPRGLDYLMQEGFANPVPFPMVPGALGHESHVRIDADLVAYMQLGDYFGGVTISDWTISESRAANARLYGRPYSTADFVRGAGFFHLPPAARAWRGTITAYFREMS